VQSFLFGAEYGAANSVVLFLCLPGLLAPDLEHVPLDAYRRHWKKAKSPWWDALVSPFLQEAVFQGEAGTGKGIERRHVKKNMDFNELYDFIMVLAVGYSQLRIDGEIVIDEALYRANPDIAALRDFLEEFALVPLRLLSAHKTGGSLSVIRARTVRALIALGCSNYTTDWLQFLLNYEKLKMVAPHLADMFDENANNQSQAFIERMHALMAR
jgi:hypothetical protein